MSNINAQIKIAKQGIWTRANATANPKAYIIKQQYMSNAVPGSAEYCYNMALSAAKKWATAKPEPVAVYSIDMEGVDYLPAA